MTHIDSVDFSWYLRQQPQARRIFLCTGYFGIKEHSQDKTQLTALNKAEGIDIGSTLIDGQAKRLVKDRLQALSVAGKQEGCEEHVPGSTTHTLMRHMVT